MFVKILKNAAYLVLTLFSMIGLHLATAPPSQAHWADMSAAEILVQAAAVQINLTYPTGLTSFADDDQNGQLSSAEIQNHRSELQNVLGTAIRLHNSENQAAQISLQAAPSSQSVQAAPNSHSTVQLLYSWPQPPRGFKIHYSLFLPGVSTASCLATILQNGQLQTFVFTPHRQVLALSASSRVGLLLALGGALVWGALHSLSPGHGKTLVAAYLVGARATPRHALVLALTTTVTHTLGIFSLGLVTLFASRYILPEQLYPWMNLVSGFLVVLIGGNLLKRRLSKRLHDHSHYDQGHHDAHHGDHHDHYHHHSYHSSQVSLVGIKAAESTVLETSERLALAPVSSAHLHLQNDRGQMATHHHSHNQIHDHADNCNHHPGRHNHSHHSHSHHSHLHHSHLPPDGPVTWRSLILLGISGGLVPCPAALVLLLSCIALGNVGLGLLLVGAFSLGLAVVLTGLGLLLVYARQSFDAPIAQRVAQFLPKPLSQLMLKTGVRGLSIASAAGITAIGIGLVTQAALQILAPF